MGDERITSTDAALALDVALAKTGDRAALESIVRAVYQDVYSLAVRFLWHPEDAEDATQEILIRIITGLGGFRGESAFRTWVYRIACNSLLTIRKRGMELHSVSFEEFGEDLAQGLSDSPLHVEGGPDEALLLEELKIGCTHAMLLCLDRDHRLAYILGAILELGHNEAASVLDVTPAAFRKRLSRARAAVTSFMTSRCGLVNPALSCRCRRRVATAIELGRVDPQNLLFAASPDRAKQFPLVLEEIRRLESTQRAAALYKSHAIPMESEPFVSWLRAVLDEKPKG